MLIFWCNQITYFYPFITVNIKVTVRQSYMNIGLFLSLMSDTLLPFDPISPKAFRLKGQTFRINVESSTFHYGHTGKNLTYSLLHEFMKSSKIKVQFFEIISKFTPLSLYNCALHKLL